MSRALVYVALVALALTAVAIGSWPIALAAAALKAVLVGFEFMELREAHPAHCAGFMVLVGGIAVVLLAIA